MQEHRAEVAKLCIRWPNATSEWSRSISSRMRSKTVSRILGNSYRKAAPSLSAEFLIAKSLSFCRNPGYGHAELRTLCNTELFYTTSSVGFCRQDTTSTQPEKTRWSTDRVLSRRELATPIIGQAFPQLNTTSCASSPRFISPGRRLDEMKGTCCRTNSRCHGI